LTAPGRQQPDFLPYGRQSVDEDDIAAVAAVLRGDWLTTGPAVPAFESALAEAVGARHAVVCSSGTAALHLAYLAAAPEPGDVVVVPSITFLATATAARLAGAEVVFADVDPDTALMGPDHLEAALAEAGGRARIVAPVHFAGQAADMPAIAAIARREGLTVVEDACHALGTEAGGGRVGDGSHADMSVFSFHPVKTVAMGEGGAVATPDAHLAERMATLRNHGIVRDAGGFENRDLAFADDGTANPWYYEMRDPGLNYRASDIHCALGLSQLRKLGRNVARRRALAARYDAALAELSPLVRPLRRVPGCSPAWHLYVVLIDFAAAGIDRAALMRGLADAGIGSQVHYIPVHRQPYYRERYGARDLPGAMRFYERALSLPLYPAMADSDVDRVVEALAGALAGRAPTARRGTA